MARVRENRSQEKIILASPPPPKRGKGPSSGGAPFDYWRIPAPPAFCTSWHQHGGNQRRPAESGRAADRRVVGLDRRHCRPPVSGRAGALERLPAAGVGHWRLSGSLV